MRPEMLLRQLDAIAVERGGRSLVGDYGRLDNRDFGARPELDGDLEESLSRRLYL